MMHLCTFRMNVTLDKFQRTLMFRSQSISVKRALSLHQIARAFHQDSHRKEVKQTEKQSGQCHRRHHHLFKRTAQTATGTKAKKLVEIVMPLSNVKEEIYGTLDEWVAFEIEFPSIAIGKGLKILKHQEQWQRIIQVSKWMLSKGQGRTFGTYELLLRAYDMDARLEDVETLWEKLRSHYMRSTSKVLFSRMMNIYKRRRMPRKLVEVFEQMEDLKVKPDKDMLVMVSTAYEELGICGKQNEFIEKYAPPQWKYYKSDGRKRKVAINL